VTSRFFSEATLSHRHQRRYHVKKNYMYGVWNVKLIHYSQIRIRRRLFWRSHTPSVFIKEGKIVWISKRVFASQGDLVYYLARLYYWVRWWCIMKQHAFCKKRCILTHYPLCFDKPTEERAKPASVDASRPFLLGIYLFLVPARHAIALPNNSVWRAWSGLRAMYWFCLALTSLEPCIVVCCFRQCRGPRQRSR
jgi:hypothetical protein